MKNGKGFTLVEVMAAVAILGIVMVCLMTVFSQGSKTFRKAEAHNEQIIAGRSILEMITRELKGAILNGHRAADVGPNIKFVGSSAQIEFVAPIDDLSVMWLDTTQDDSKDKHGQYLCNVGYRYDAATSTLDRYTESFTSVDAGKAAAAFQQNIGTWDWSDAKFVQPLWENVALFKLQYWVAATKTQAGYWTDKWDSRSIKALPLAIWVEIEIGDSMGTAKPEYFSTVLHLAMASVQ